MDLVQRGRLIKSKDERASQHFTQIFNKSQNSEL
mgnify:CR=1 FL=1